MCQLRRENAWFSRNLSLSLRPPPMANETMEIDQAGPFLPQSPYGFLPLNPALERIRQELVRDVVVIMQPPEKEPGLHGYGQPQPCLDLYQTLESQVGTFSLSL